MRGDGDQVTDVRNRRPNISLPINPMKMAKTNATRFGCAGMFEIDLTWFGLFATRCSLAVISI